MSAPRAAPTTGGEAAGLPPASLLRGDSARTVADPLGLLSLFSGTLTPSLLGEEGAPPTATGSSVWRNETRSLSGGAAPKERPKSATGDLGGRGSRRMDAETEQHVDSFVRRKWEQAHRSAMSKTKRAHAAATLLDPPPPLYRLSSRRKSSETIEPAVSGESSRSATMRVADIDSTLPPATSPEPSGQVPKWLCRSPDVMAPHNRPRVESTKRVYLYGDEQRETADGGDELRFDSHFESGNLLSATRVHREQNAGPRSVNDLPWVVDREYDLQMHPDLRTCGNTQWYFFEISNARPGVRYRFNVTNFAKSDSLYLEGMQPLLYSTQAAKTAGVGWHRAGSVVCYSRNSGDVHRQQVADMRAAVGLGDGDVDDGESSASGSASDGSDEDEPPAGSASASASSSTGAAPHGSGSGSRRDVSPLPPKPAHPSAEKRRVPKGSGTHTMSFDIEFEHDGDVVYLAYSHPYTYTDLQRFLNKLMTDPKTQHTASRKELCKTIAGNRCDLMTITAPPYVKKPSKAVAEGDSEENEAKSEHDAENEDSAAAAASSSHERRLIVISARVHPGESNSSWIMHGMLDFLTSVHPAAVVLRKHFVFKVVPMLNPDGVINGNYRCSLSGQDLNRHWHMPCRAAHPTISAFKHLIQAYQSRDESRVALFCDLHGHSRAQGLFLYGILSEADKHHAARQASRRNVASKGPAAQRHKGAAAAAAAGGEENVADDDDNTALHSESSRHLQQQLGPSTDADAADEGGDASHKLLKAKSSASSRKSFRAGDPRLFPIMLAKRTAGIFTKKKTSFKLGRGKSCTARAVVCRELGVRRSYTLEVSFCGGVGGVYQEAQFTTKDLMHMGRQWCLTLVDFFGLNDELATMVELSKIASGGREPKTTAPVEARDEDSTPVVGGTRPAKDEGGAVSLSSSSSTRTQLAANSAGEAPADSRHDESDKQGHHSSQQHNHHKGGRQKKAAHHCKRKAHPSSTKSSHGGAEWVEAKPEDAPSCPAENEAADWASAAAAAAAAEKRDSSCSSSRREDETGAHIESQSLDMSMFSAIAQEADRLLNDTQGLTLDSPDLWLAYRGINDESDAKSEIDLQAMSAGVTPGGLLLESDAADPSTEGFGDFVQPTAGTELPRLSLVSVATSDDALAGVEQGGPLLPLDMSSSSSTRQPAELTPSRPAASSPSRPGRKHPGPRAIVESAT